MIKQKILVHIAAVFILVLLIGFVVIVERGSPPALAPIQGTLIKGQLMRAQSGESNLPLAATGPLVVDPLNRRYFRDGNGKAVFLTGSHTWDNRQDLGNSPFDYAQYLTALQQYNHNFIKMWLWEQPKGITTGPDPAQPNATLTPEIFARVGPGKANDGGLQFDLTKYNQTHFDRLRQRIIDAGNKGIYVSVMLFDGFSVEQKAGGANPWVYHPFNASNNINSINGDPNNDQGGVETHTLQIPDVTALQEAYVRKVIDTVNDLDNVLYEISNESDVGSTAWEYHMINYIKWYEATKAKQHPVGMTAEWPGGSNSDLFASPADWIAPNGDGGYGDTPPIADGSKVVILDTDHIWGIGGDRAWAWKSFTRGYSVIYMDPWNGTFIPVSANDDLRVNMGYILTYAERMNLEAMVPHPELCSTNYCLANTVPVGAEYLVYLPNGGGVDVDISAASGQLLVEWFNPANGTVAGTGIIAGGAMRSFTVPFSGDAVLYIYTQVPATQTPTNTPISPIATRTNTPSGPTATRTNTPQVPTATRTSTPPSQPQTATATQVFSTATPTDGLVFPTLTFTVPVGSTATNTAVTETATSITGTEQTQTASSTPTLPGSDPSSGLRNIIILALICAAIIGTLLFILWIFRLLRQSAR